MTPTEEQRLEAEIRRLDAGAAKLVAEREAIQRAGKWWVASEPVRYIISIIIAAGLLSVWFKVQLEPLMLAKIEIGRAQNELDSVRNQLAQEQLKKEVAVLSDKNHELLGQYTQLQKYSESALAELQRQKPETVAGQKEQQKELEALKAQVRELREAKAETERRLKNQLTESLTSKVLPSLSGLSGIVPRPAGRAVCVTKSGKTCPYYLALPGQALPGQSCSCSGTTLGDFETGSVSMTP